MWLCTIAKKPHAACAAFAQPVYYPKLAKYNGETIGAIEDNQPELRRPYSNSMCSACTWNLGPNTITAEHCDGHNCAFGVCPVRAFGNYNHKKGGHIYMKPTNSLSSSPRGSPSPSCLYIAGTLFRWKEHGFQTAKSLLATEGGTARKATFDGEPGARAPWAVGLSSKVEELEEDRRAGYEFE
ncbi:hypothetical protein B0H14DRAFT_3864229 [Mycena olivaceomarginata]|nr:hypothetical protein B0H14DRAFT_3864229 [Mycena olivaceomarginata]